MTALAELPLRAITPAVVSEWYAAALRGTGGRTSIQQSYRFLRAVMNTAVHDGAITKNRATSRALAPTAPRNAPSRHPFRSPR